MGKRARPNIREPKVGEDLKDVLSRAIKSGQPIRGGVTPLLYTDAKDENARLATDIRTDRMEVAQRMHDKVNNSKANAAKAEGRQEAAEMAAREGASAGGE